MKNKKIGIIVSCNFLLSMTIIYFSPRFDILTLLLFLALNLLLFLTLFLKEKKDKEKINKKIEDSLSLIHSLDLNNENYEIVDDEFGKLRDEIVKIILENKRIANQKTKNQEMIMEYTEDIAHQIKTPITGALLMLDLMEDDGNFDKQYTNHIRKNLLRLLNLADILLKMASLDSETNSLKKESTNAFSLAEDVKEELENYFSNYFVKVTITGSDFSLICDRQWTYEALFNIAKNGIEASGKKSIEIELKETNLFKSFIVKDKSKGMKKHELENAYKRFHKGNSSSEGYGIGLPLAKQIIEKQNGELIYTKEKNYNSFELRFYK